MYQYGVVAREATQSGKDFWHTTLEVVLGEFVDFGPDLGVAIRTREDVYPIGALLESFRMVSDSPPEVVIARIEEMKQTWTGANGYNYLTRNCEHFLTNALGLTPSSPQVGSTGWGAAGGAAAGWLLGELFCESRGEKRFVTGTFAAIGGKVRASSLAALYVRHGLPVVPGSAVKERVQALTIV